MSQLWVNQELILVDPGFTYLIILWDGKVCRLPPGKGKQKEKKEKTGLGRGEGMPTRKEKKEERKRWGLKRSRKVQQVKKPRCVPGSAAHLSQLSVLLQVSLTHWQGTVLRGAWK